MVDYYEGEIEPIEFIAGSFSDDEYRGFLKGNIIKYISRAGKKGHAIDDLKKAGVYLEWLLELESVDDSDIACKSLEQIMKEADTELTKKKFLKYDLEDKHRAWLRERDSRSWT